MTAVQHRWFKRLTVGWAPSGQLTGPETGRVVQPSGTKPQDSVGEPEQGKFGKALGCIQ
jgi:hypothetical protein